MKEYEDDVRYVFCVKCNFVDGSKGRLFHRKQVHIYVERGNNLVSGEKEVKDAFKRKAQTTATKGGRDESRQVHIQLAKPFELLHYPRPFNVTQWTNIKNYKFIHFFPSAGRINGNVPFLMKFVPTLLAPHWQANFIVLVARFILETSLPAYHNSIKKGIPFK